MVIFFIGSMTEERLLSQLQEQNEQLKRENELLKGENH